MENKRIAPADIAAWRFVFAVLAAIFTAEILMIGLKLRMEHIPHPWEDVFDMLVLSVMLVPALYFFLYTPMIRAKRRADEAAEWNREVLEMIIETTPDPVYYKDAAGKYRGCNRAFERLVGKEKAEILGSDVLGVVGSQYGQLFRQKDLELLKDPGTQHFEATVFADSGERRDLQFHKAAFLSPEGAVDGVVGVVNDVTTLNALRNALDKEREMNRMIVENAPVVIFALDTEGRFTFCAGRGLKARGLTPEDLLGKSLFEVYADNPAITGSCRRALAGEEVNAYVQVAEVVYDVYWTPYYNDLQKLSGVIGVALVVKEL